MLTLLDTNILLRSSLPNGPDYGVTIAAVDLLVARGRSICIGSQTIYEFLAVATRPVANNGLGMDHAYADAQLAKLLKGVAVFYDSKAVATALRRLVVSHQVIGKKVHDARLVATMAPIDVTKGAVP